MKSKFNILYQQIILQGGKAMQNFLQEDDLAKLQRIKKQNVKPTIDFIQKNILNKIGVQKDMWTAQLGSTRKKGYFWGYRHSNQNGFITIEITVKFYR